MTYLATTFAQICNVVLFHRRFRKTSGLHHDMVLGCQNPSLLWQSTADVRASVSIERFKLFPTSLYSDTLARLAHIHPAKNGSSLGSPLRTGRLPLSHRRWIAGFSGRKATLIDYRFGKM